MQFKTKAMKKNYQKKLLFPYALGKFVWIKYTKKMKLNT